MGLNKLMRRRVSGSVATRVTMRATLVQLREDEDETTSVRAITLHCELKIGRGDPTGLLYGRASRARARGGSHAPQTHEDQTCGVAGPRAHEDQTLPSVQLGSDNHDLGWTGPEILISISHPEFSLFTLLYLHCIILLFAGR